MNFSLSTVVKIAAIGLFLHVNAGNAVVLRTSTLFLWDNSLNKLSFNYPANRETIDKLAVDAVNGCGGPTARSCN